MSNLAQETTFLAAHTILKGELQVSGPCTISGRVEGAISGTDQIEITREGSVEGDVQGAFLDIQGTVKGNILATQTCRLGATARVSGELRAANLAIVEGACFVGQVFVGGPTAQVEAAPAAMEEEETVEVIEAPAPANRLATLAAQAEEVAATAASAGPSLNVVQENIQHAMNRTPKIIRARA